MADPVVTPSQFRQDFPEFEDPLIYSDRVINFQVAVATSLLNSDRWDTLLPYGIELYTAHLLVLARRAVLASLAGGVPGTPQGLLTAKAIDKVSASYDVSAIMTDGAGFYNQTVYGQQLYQLILRVGAGPIQVNEGVIVGYSAFLGLDTLYGL